LTDSLSMETITKYTKNISATVLAILAGNDIIVTSAFEKHIEELIKAVEKNEVDMSLINKAAKRVIAWKLKYIYEQEKEQEKEKNKFIETNSKSNVILFIIIISIIIVAFIIFDFLWKYKYKNNEDNISSINDEYQYI